MTPGLQALADGFAETLATHGQVWVRTSDSAAITGVASRVKTEEPHMANAQDRDVAVLIADRSLIPIVPAASAMPVSRLKKGDELTKGSRKYRVTRSDYQESNALWLAILSPTF